MVYSTRKQTERFEDALMELGALGLLEIEGQKLLQESSELNAAEETQPTEKTWNTVKRNLWRQKQKNRISKATKVIRPVFVRAALLCTFPWDRIDFGCFSRCQGGSVPAAFFGIREIY